MWTENRSSLLLFREILTCSVELEKERLKLLKTFKLFHNDLITHYLFFTNAMTTQPNILLFILDEVNILLTSSKFNKWDIALKCRYDHQKREIHLKWADSGLN